jgi:glycosyltransferase involved in cell wall biosynthesis
LVNDCSEYEIYNKLVELSSLDSRIFLFSLETRKGAGFARNYALSLAKGKYVLFIDSDDYLYDQEALKKLYAKAKANNADVLLFEYALKKDYSFSSLRHPAWDTLLKKPYMKKSFVLDDINECLLLPAYPWNKIYKRSFLLQNEISCSSTICHNDIALSLNSLIAAQRIALLPECLIVHRMTDNIQRLSNDGGRNRLDLFTALTDVDNFVETHPIEQQTKLYLLRFKWDAFQWGYGRIAEKYRKLFIYRFSKNLKHVPRKILKSYRKKFDVGRRDSLKLFLIKSFPLLYYSYVKCRNRFAT